MGRLVVLAGVIFVIVGVVLVLAGRFPMPGNVSYRRGGLTVFAPLGTMLLISIVLTIVVNVLLRIGR